MKKIIILVTILFLVLTVNVVYAAERYIYLAEKFPPYVRLENKQNQYIYIAKLFLDKNKNIKFLYIQPPKSKKDTEYFLSMIAKINADNDVFFAGMEKFIYPIGSKEYKNTEKKHLYDIEHRRGTTVYATWVKKNNPYFLNAVKQFFRDREFRGFRILTKEEVEELTNN